MFVEERCLRCKEFFTPFTVKNDKCKCMRKEDLSYSLRKKNKYGKFFQKYNEETRKRQYEIFVKSLTR